MNPTNNNQDKKPGMDYISYYNKFEDSKKIQEWEREELRRRLQELNDED